MRAVAFPARRAHDVGHVVDVELDEALVVEPQHPTSVGVAVEPAPEGGAQPVMRDLGAFVPEAPFAVETDAALSQLLDLGVGRASRQLSRCRCSIVSLSCSFAFLISARSRLLVGAEREMPLELGESHFQSGVFAAKGFEAVESGPASSSLPVTSAYEPSLLRRAALDQLGFGRAYVGGRRRREIVEIATSRAKRGEPRHVGRAAGPAPRRAGARASSGYFRAPEPTTTSTAVERARAAPPAAERRSCAVERRARRRVTSKRPA